MDFNTPLDVAYSGMNAQSARLKVIAENLANADSTASTPGGKPYQRQVVTFTDVFDRALGVKQRQGRGRRSARRRRLRQGATSRAIPRPTPTATC